jgi:hypothetical protein
VKFARIQFVKLRKTLKMKPELSTNDLSTPSISEKTHKDKIEPGIET